MNIKIRGASIRHQNKGTSKIRGASIRYQNREAHFEYPKIGGASNLEAHHEISK
jgi:hypothetical protein